MGNDDNDDMGLDVVEQVRALVSLPSLLLRRLQALKYEAQCGATPFDPRPTPPILPLTPPLCVCMGDPSVTLFPCSSSV